jgi:hypothetical protein
MDPYRAGLEIAEDLLDIQPEIIFLFSSIHYEGSVELTEAIYDVIESDSLIIIGCSGDGFYEQNKVANVGASALALNSHGTIEWYLDYEKGVALEPFAATSRCLERLGKSCPEPRVFFLFSDFRTDASEVVRAVTSYPRVPVIGGMAGDNFRMERSFVYINREVFTDTVALLALNGDFPFDIFAVHNTKPEGKIGTVTGCQATAIQTINNMPAMQFVEEAMGKPVEYLDTGTITGNIMNPDTPDLMRHRSLLLSKDQERDTDIQLFGGIAEGELIQLCLTNPAKIVAEVETVATRIDQLTFQPAAAVIISCAGRKQLLGNKNAIEIKALASAKNVPNALVGFPSFGEISPIKTAHGYTQSLFHNMTYVLFAFGKREI